MRQSLPDRVCVSVFPEVENRPPLPFHAEFFLVIEFFCVTPEARDQIAHILGKFAP